MVKGQEHSKNSLWEGFGQSAVENKAVFDWFEISENPSNIFTLSIVLVIIITLQFTSS